MNRTDDADAGAGSPEPTSPTDLPALVREQDWRLREPAWKQRAAREAAARRRRRIAVRAIWIAVAALAAGGAVVAVAWAARELAGAPVHERPAASATAPAKTTSTLTPTTVPDVLGMSLAEATEVLEAAGLTVGDIVPEPRAGARVRGTDPTPGEAVVAGTAVVVYVDEDGH